MKTTSERPIACELLAPAGDLKRLHTAFYYGADAVYFGYKAFSLRAYADNFSMDEIREGVAAAHAQGKRAYACANIFMKNADEGAMGEYLQELEHIGVDGAIVTDPGTVWLARRKAPDLELHLSTQANTLNGAAARFWEEQGIKRLVLARELTAKEIAEIRAATTVELEAFVHGAMCISYSGRCLLSNYLSHRDGNRGECVQACRWNYQFREANRDGDWFQAEEDARGTYFLSSKDLNLLGRLAELKAAGVTSFKIEGRMKGEYYLATVVNAYRRALNAIEGGMTLDLEALQQELNKIAHRDYTEGYWNGENADTVNYLNAQRADSATFIAVVTGYENGVARIEMRNRFQAGQTAEVLSPSLSFGARFELPLCKDEEGAPVADAKLVQQTLFMPVPVELHAGDILRRIER